MATYDLPEAAKRIGVSVEELSRSVELGIITPDAENRFTRGHLRRAALVTSLTAAGIPLEGLGAAIRSGQVSLAFLDAPAFDYAPPGEVIVSQEVVDASAGADVAFREVGPVELKGVSSAMRLYAASRPG